MSILKDLKTPIFQAEGLLHIPKEKAFVDFYAEDKKICSLSLAEILALPQTTLNLRLTSVSGWSVRANWQGVMWKDLIDELGIRDNSPYIIFASHDTYTTNVYRADVLPEKWLLCHSVDDEPLEDEYGGPIRMVISNLWGYKSCKWLASVNFSSKNEPGFWETRGYTDRGLIEKSITLDVNSREKKEIQGGEVTEF